MTKKSKIIVSIVGALLFVAIIVSGSVTCYALKENSPRILSSAYIEYQNAPNVIQENAVYFSKAFFEENDLIFTAADDAHKVDDGVDEVLVRGLSHSLSSYYLDFTRRNEDIKGYSFCLKRREDSDKTPVKIEARCFSENLTIRLNESKYGGCTYKRIDANGDYYIHIDTPAKKCEVMLHISVMKSYEFSAEELTSIYEGIVRSMIDNIVTYDEITARGGVLW